jgi:hypothetical protein
MKASRLLLIAALFVLNVHGQNGPNAVATVERAVAAHGNKVGSAKIADIVYEGSITYFTTAGPQATFDLTLYKKGDDQVQKVVTQKNRVIKQGGSGSVTWDSVDGQITSSAQGRASHFIESQTVRSVQALFDYAASGLSLRDNGKKGGKTVVEAEDNRGRKTKYSIDDTTSTVTALEFDTGQARDPFSKRIVPKTDAYVFSDFQKVQGVLTPFKIERFINGIKAEEMRFTRIRYNTSVAGSLFRP